MAFLKYNLWRGLLFLVVWAVLWLWWGDVWLSAFAAIVVSGIASYFLLRRQREAWVATIQERADRAVANARANQANESKDVARATETDPRDHFDDEDDSAP